MSSNHSNAEQLRSALEQIDVGVVLLNRDLNAQFINAAFERLWLLTPGDIPPKAAFAEILRLVSGKRRKARPADEVDAYIRDRIELVRSGVEDVRDLRLDDGEVIRVSCKALPCGGRMLVYTTVGDLVHHADELERLATTDELTGIWNRRHFLKVANQAWDRARSEALPLSLLMLDIDAFKSINDSFGHEVGDRVIRHVAILCKEMNSDTDILARIGGEEFALLLSGTSKTQARGFAERLREHIAATPVHIDAQQLYATVSIGISSSESGMTDLTDLMKAADRALYAAKAAGRNCAKHISQELGHVDWFSATDVITRAFDEACQGLGIQANALQQREQIARKILDLALNGLVDAGSLLQASVDRPLALQG